MADAQVTLASLRALTAEIGVWAAARVSGRVLAQQLRGEPFGHLPPAQDWRERGSRQQAGDAVRLYRALCALFPPERAQAVAHRVVEAGGVRFLQATIGPLRRAALAALDEPQRRAFLEERGQRFPNATPTWERVDADGVSFTISSCRLVSLAAEAGHPELGPMFCASDARFFGEVEPDVVLDRPETLARGDARCAFRLAWRPGEGEDTGCS